MENTRCEQHGYSWFAAGHDGTMNIPFTHDFAHCTHTRLPQDPRHFGGYAPAKAADRLHAATDSALRASTHTGNLFCMRTLRTHAYRTYRAWFGGYGMARSSPENAARTTSNYAPYACRAAASMARPVLARQLYSANWFNRTPRRGPRRHCDMVYFIRTTTLRLRVTVGCTFRLAPKTDSTWHLTGSPLLQSLFGENSGSFAHMRR